MIATGEAIRINELTRRFDEVVAVDRLDLVVDDEIFGLLGPNGAGKTTTIKMLITLLPPTSGDARWPASTSSAQPSLVRRRIGYVPQLLSADGALTGRENLDLSARLYHLPGDERDGADRTRHSRSWASTTPRTASSGPTRAG